MKKSFYVYGLFEPNPNGQLDNCFYIGKGTRDRMKRHFSYSSLNEDKIKNPHKTRKILKLRKNERNPYARKLIDNLTEKKALEIEKILIEEIGLENLTNLTPGGGVPLSGKNHPMWDKSHTEKWKITHSEVMSGDNNPMKRKRVREKFLGKNNPYSKLEENDVKEIKWLLENTEISQKTIGNVYGVKQGCVSKIKLGRIWNHVNEKKKPNFNISDLKEEREYLSGSDHPMWNKSHNQETKNKISKKLKGEKHPRSKLTITDVQEIKWLLDNVKNPSADKIADRYNVTTGAISGIKSGNSWSSIEEKVEPEYKDVSKTTLNQNQVKQIKWLLENSNLTQKEIGDKYGVKQGCVSKIKLGQVWKNIEEKKKPDWFKNEK